MPALYEAWNQEGKDIQIKGIGNNLEGALSPALVETLSKILPWCDAATPILGTCTAGHYNAETHNWAFTSADFKNRAGRGTNCAQGTLNSGQQLVDSSTNSIVGNKLTSILNNTSIDQFLPGQTSCAGNVRNAIEKTFGLKILKPSELNPALDNNAVNYGTSLEKVGFVKVPYTPGTQYPVGAVKISGSGSGHAAGHMEVVPNESAAQSGTWQWYNKGAATAWNSYSNDISVYIPSEDLYKKANANAQYNASALTIGTGNADCDQPKTNATAFTDANADGNAQNLLPADHPFRTPAGALTSKPEEDGAAPEETGTKFPDQTGGTPAFEVKTNLTPPSWLENDTEFQTTLNNFKQQFPGLSKEQVYAMMQGESGYNSNNSTGSYAGLFQLKPGEGGAPDAETIKRSSPAQQLTWYMNYASKAGYNGSQPLPLYNAAPGYMQQGRTNSGGSMSDPNTIIYASGSREATNNPGWRDANGNVTVASVQRYYFDNGNKNNTPSNVPPPGQGVARSSSNTIHTTTPIGPSPVDTNGMAAGMFAVPNVGAFLWVFFQEGNPLFPVYFAASFGPAEWSSAYKASSPSLYYPNAADGTKHIGQSSIMRPNGAGGIEFNDSYGDAVGDQRKIKLFAHTGAHHMLGPNGTVMYDPHAMYKQTDGHSFDAALGNREFYTQGDSNHVTIGDQLVKIGNISQEAYEAAVEHQAILEEAYKLMDQGRA
jgi:hypothetical protein